MNAASPPAPREITADVDALIQAAANEIEQAISRPAHQDVLRLREMVRGMIEAITISRHDSGAIEIGVCGAFAGVMRAAGLVERHALQTKKPSGAFAREGFSIGGCGGSQPPRDAALDPRSFPDHAFLIFESSPGQLPNLVRRLGQHRHDTTSLLVTTDRISTFRWFRAPRCDRLLIDGKRW